MSAVLSSIPRYPGDVTPAWLSAALSGRGAPVEVAEVDVVAIGTGQTGATYRVTARYATDPGDLPRTFVIKLPAQDDTVRDRVVIGYRSECAFYSSVVDRVQVPTRGASTPRSPRMPWILPCCSPIRRRRCRAISSSAAGNRSAPCGYRAGRPARAQLVRPRLAGFPRHRVRPSR